MYEINELDEGRLGLLWRGWGLDKGRFSLDEEVDSHETYDKTDRRTNAEREKGIYFIRKQWRSVTDDIGSDRRMQHHERMIKDSIGKETKGHTPYDLSQSPEENTNGNR